MGRLDIASQPVRDMIADLVKHHVAITSTLSVFEAFDGSRPPLEPRFLDVTSPEAAVSYLSARSRARGGEDSASIAQMHKELEFELAFVKAGGLLVFGCDPTGNGGAMAGFGDQRNLELLVEGGFTPVQAIQIATSEWRQTARGTRSFRHNRPWKGCGPGSHRWQSGRPNRRHPQDHRGIQRWRGLRPHQAHRLCPRRGWDALKPPTCLLTEVFHIVRHSDVLQLICFFAACDDFFVGQQFAKIPG